MTVSVSDIRTRFPEFDNSAITSDALITMLIDEAETRTPATIWGSKQDAGIRYLTAHLLALSPQARELKLATADGSTPYLAERQRLERIVSSGFRTTGDTSGLP